MTFASTPPRSRCPRSSIVLVRVYNHGTRDAANVPIQVANEAGRTLDDVVPLVQGSGSGVVAIRVGSLWSPGGTLTFTVNPEDAKGRLPRNQPPGQRRHVCPDPEGTRQGVRAAHFVFCPALRYTGGHPREE
jgi:hypothetical protein